MNISRVENLHKCNEIALLVCVAWSPLNHLAHTYHYYYYYYYYYLLLLLGNGQIHSVIRGVSYITQS